MTTDPIQAVIAALLALLGAGGIVGVIRLIKAAFSDGLEATAKIQERQVVELERQAATIARQDREIDDLNDRLLSARRTVAERDIMLAEQRARNLDLETQLARATGTSPT